MTEAANFVVSFPRQDFPFLEAAAVVHRSGTAWFDIDATGVALNVMGDELGLRRQLDATVTTGTPTIAGFGVTAAHLASVARIAKNERWASLDIPVALHADTATIVQDRIILTGGVPPESNLFEDILPLDNLQLDRSDVNLTWDRPSALDNLNTGEANTALHVAALQECLDTAEKLIPADAEQPHYQLLEFADGLAHGGSLNLRFCLEAAPLKGVVLRLSRSQLRPLSKLLNLFEALQSHYVSTSDQHYKMTDTRTTLYATIPAHRHSHRAVDVLSNRPNTEAVVSVSSLRDKVKQKLRTGRGLRMRDQILRMQLTDEEVPRLFLTTFSWKDRKRNASAGTIPLIRSEIAFDALTELSLVDKVMDVCNKQIVLQRDAEWFYLRSVGQYTQLTAKIRAYATEPHHLSTQLRSLLQLR